MLKSQAAKLPQLPGVYLYKDAENKVIYVGKARNLKKRVASYFKKDLLTGEKTKRLIKESDQIDYIVTESEMEALLLETDLIKRLKPRYNIRMKDDKSFKYIKVTVQETYPRVLTTRQKKSDGARYFGPFPEGGTVALILRDLRRMFPYCNEAEKRLGRHERGCFYSNIGLCPGVCHSQITQKEYRRQINRIVQFLSGRKDKVIKGLKTQMNHFARKNDFEAAATIRDKINRIEYITQRFHTSADFLENPNLREDLRRKEIEELCRILYLTVTSPNSQFLIEAYDMSNLSGTNAVGSMVVFTNGEPAKSEYRRFRIKRKGAKGDTDFMREVLYRRFKRASSPLPNPEVDKSFSTLPNLILVDGGMPQVNTAIDVLKDTGMNIPVIGLAKKWEEIILPSGKSIRLPKNNQALQLLQRLRDEAHRFAYNYHADLERKQLTE